MKSLLLFLAGGIDIALTLFGQSVEYWQGDYASVNEGNPFAKPLLILSPWLFLAATILYLIALVVVQNIWKHRIAGWIALVAFAGHIFGGASWMLNEFPLGWAFAVAYTSAMVGIWTWYGSFPGKQCRQRHGEAGQQ